MKIKRYFSFFLICSLTFSLITKNQVFAQENDQNNSICTENLDQAIAEVINRPEYIRSRWGIMVKELNSEKIFYNLNGEKYFIPASNTKLFTTAAVLLKYGVNYRFQTPIFIEQTNNNINSLRLIGQGDPSLNNRDLEVVAQKLKEENINQIDHLIVEENNKNLGINPSWEWEDIYFYYGANINSLILNENTFELTILPQNLGEKVSLIWSDPIAENQFTIINNAITAEENTPYNISINGVLGEPILAIKGELAINSGEDSWGLAILNPSQYFLDSFKSILTKNEIIIYQSLINNLPSEKSENERLFMTIESDTLAELVFKTNQESNNLYAEAFFQLLGDQETLKDTLKELGINPNSYNLKDGSGLSRHNLVTPESLVEILDFMSQTSVAEIYQNSLPIAGVGGTLKNRFTNTFLANNLTGKTGTASGISALSGYLTTKEGEKLVFSILINNSDESSATLRKGIDEIALIFAKVKECN